MSQRRSSASRNRHRPPRTVASRRRSSSALTPVPGAVIVSTPLSVGRSRIGRFGVSARCYPPGIVRLIEIRLLEGPSVYRREPVVKVEVALGRRRSWYGPRVPAHHLLVRLGGAVPRGDRAGGGRPPGGRA